MNCVTSSTSSSGSGISISISPSSKFNFNMEVEEWRLCVADIEMSERLWLEGLLPLNNIEKFIPDHKMSFFNDQIMKLRMRKNYMQEQIRKWESQSLELEHEAEAVPSITTLRSNIRQICKHLYMFYLEARRRIRP